MPAPAEPHRAAGQRTKVFREGTRGKQGTPATAQRYEDFAPAIGMRRAGGMAEEVYWAARNTRR